MKMELELQLSKKYTQLFVDSDKPPTESLMCFGCDHGDGWFFIIEAMCHLIDQHIKNDGWDQKASYKFVQIKEKFGGLRVYDYGADDYIRGVIDMAESLSYRVCELCGDQGSKYHSGMWVKTLCETHAEENGYEKYSCEEEP
jgi:hypothetical protein